MSLRHIHEPAACSGTWNGQCLSLGHWQEGCSIHSLAIVLQLNVGMCSTDPASTACVADELSLPDGLAGVAQQLPIQVPQLQSPACSQVHDDSHCTVTVCPASGSAGHRSVHRIIFPGVADVSALMPLSCIHKVNPVEGVGDAVVDAACWPVP